MQEWITAVPAVEPALTWDDLDWLASLSSLPVMLKGILHPDDAVRAVDHGARAVIVSNHGGRQLDSAVAALDALPAVVEAVAGRAEVLVDGGVRRGTDILKALALGARAVLIGRPPARQGSPAAGRGGGPPWLNFRGGALVLDLMLCGLAPLWQTPAPTSQKENPRERGPGTEPKGEEGIFPKAK